MSISPEELVRLGVFDPKRLQLQADNEPAWIVDGLFQYNSVNLLVGDSGLGKTPLVVQLGVSVAAGVPFLGRPTQKGMVLVADFESSAKAFSDVTAAVSRFLKLPEVPAEFLVWSPEWKKPDRDNYREELLHRVERVQPNLVIVDPLRLFDPDAPMKNEEAAKLFKAIRRNGANATWLFLHHCRKSPTDPMLEVSLVDEPRLWLNAASGARALVNHTDTRLGVVDSEGKKLGADLVVSGFIRGKETLQPTYLVRELDEQGEPMGYRVTGGLDLLPVAQRVVFKSLGDVFKYGEAKKALGDKSDSAADTFCKKLVAAGLARKIHRGVYMKIQSE